MGTGCADGIIIGCADGIIIGCADGIIIGCPSTGMGMLYIGIIGAGLMPIGCAQKHGQDQLGTSQRTTQARVADARLERCPRSRVHDSVQSASLAGSVG